MRYLFLTQTFVLSCLALFTLTAAADPASKEELRNALTPVPAVHKSKTRAWGSSETRGVEVIENSEVKPPQDDKIVPPPAPPVPPAPPTVQLQQISFEYNSAKLTPEAQLTLDNLGAVMNEPALKKSRFKLTGHTDAVGGAAFNLALSARRAQSTQAYLSKRHHVDASRLLVEGKGFSELADAENPQSAVNRRVQVTNLGQSE